MLKVLIAEDDLMIADAAEDALTAHGFEVCGIARTVAEAVSLGLLHKPDLAVIDMRLADGGLGNEIVDQLNALGGLGVLYATANPLLTALTGAAGHACLVKPYSAEALVRGLEIVADMVTIGAAVPPFPRGFQLLPLPAPKEP
jgi:DNA-binding response OmpR family regulator